jgi:hypothetical protein
MMLDGNEKSSLEMGRIFLRGLGRNRTCIKSLGNFYSIH